ncbi:MAG: NAD-dependent epimerase/dehydratase family protein [Candidatus Aenigmatarchaeota archaeon]
MKAIVAGGAGFIGSYLAEELLKRGYEVIVIDNFSSGKIENLKEIESEIEIIEGDLKNFDFVIENVKGDVVFHYAAIPEVRLSSQNPKEVFENNVISILNVLEACRINNIKYFVFASSSTVYGDAKIPTKENEEIKPISVYGASKAACESLIISYSNSFKIKSLILRYANIIGKRSKHGVIYDFINKLKNNPHELEILGDGNQEKSYLHVSEAIRATLFAFDWFINSDSLYEIFNIGSEDKIKVIEIAKIICEEMKLNPKFKFKIEVADGRLN